MKQSKQSLASESPAFAQLRRGKRKLAERISGHNRVNIRVYSTYQPANSRWPPWRSVLANTTVTVGINNILNHDPPRSNDDFPRFIYDPTGRFVYVSITKKFW